MNVPSCRTPSADTSVTNRKYLTFRYARFCVDRPSLNRFSTVWSLFTLQGLSWEARSSCATRVIYETHRFTNVFTNTPQVPTILGKTNPVTPFHTIYVILSSRLCLGPPSGLFPSGFPNKSLYTFLFSLYVSHTPRPPRPPKRNHINSIRRGVQIMKRVIMKFLPTPYYFRLITKINYSNIYKVPVILTGKS